METSFKNKLYGDGIHDDLPAIEERLSSGIKCLYLPCPEVNYLISGAITLHSGQELKIDRNARIVLMADSDSYMLKVGGQNEYCENVKVSGGIWDMNHNNQSPNPWHFPGKKTGKTGYEILREKGIYPNIFPLPEEAKGVNIQEVPEDLYTGHCMYFTNTRRLYVGDLTIVNPVVYGMSIYRVEDFTVENINFDYTEGSPKLWNMDGVHIYGHCRNGYVRNVKGACHDDAVALTSDDSFKNGPIENITIDGVYGEGSHSAVRLLSRVNYVRNVHITNIYGTFYTYTVVLSKYSDLPERSKFENINIDNVYASICPGTVDCPGNTRPIIWIGDNIDIKNLNISNLHRNEIHNNNPTIEIYEGSTIDRLSVSNSTQMSEIGGKISFIHNRGIINHLYLYNIDVGNGELMAEDGEVKNLSVI